MHAIHFVARSFRSEPLAEPACARRTWDALRAQWPKVLSACWMSDHLHVLVEDVDPKTEAEWLERSLRRMEAWADVDVDWTVAKGRTKVRRDIRYIALNPCRAQLCADPLQWLWSTHREVFGAAAQPWLDVDRLLELEGTRERHHAYVSSDPSVAVTGTPPPRVAAPSPIATRPIADIGLAALAAWRLPNGSLRSRGPARHDFVRLAPEQG